MKPYITREESLYPRLKDREYALGYLNACWEDGDDGVFLLAVYDVAKANGGLRQLAKKTGLNREHLFRMLSEGGNPTLSSLRQLVRALGFKLVFEPARSRSSRPSARHQAGRPGRRGSTRAAHRLPLSA
ncbi:MAG: putative addiction module antidote protein [Elusimicrobia bacterium]|nr:putative addiction module antidote protein [Elusimicrobiota bacterium]